MTVRGEGGSPLFEEMGGKDTPAGSGARRGETGSGQAAPAAKIRGSGRVTEIWIHHRGIMTPVRVAPGSEEETVRKMAGRARAEYAAEAAEGAGIEIRRRAEDRGRALDGWLREREEKAV